MLAALLANIDTPSVVPPIYSSGPNHGARTSASTSWNPDWSKQYGPEARRLRGDPAAVERAVEELRLADFVPPELMEAKELVHSRSLVDELNAYQPGEMVLVLESWLAFVAWRKSDDEAIAIAMLMM